MENFKKAQIILIPTKEKSQIHKQLEGNLTYFEIPIEERNLTRTYNLYIISDDDIEEGDWYHNIDMRTREYGVHQADNRLSILANNAPSCKKIIATNDSSLNEKDRFNGKSWESLLPQPSQQFIEHYIEAYNKREIIKDVLVEYEFKTIQTYPRSGRDCGGNEKYEFIETIKINSDNTINIKSTKDSWSREEVIEFGNKIREYCKNGCKQDSLHRVFFEWDKYVNENL